jgi:Putative DNA-binding domain
MSAKPVSINANVAASLSRLELGDQDLISRLKNTEDCTVERKTASDYRDCRRSAVAFSNSLPVDDPGVIFVGVKNDGTVEDSTNLDSLQRKVSEEIDRIYPPIYPQLKVMKDDSGKEFLAVIVRGSADRPHFSGPSYVRDGMQTKEASEEQFARVIAERSSKVRELRKWLGKEVVVRRTEKVNDKLAVFVLGTTGGKLAGRITDCNNFFVTLESPTRTSSRISFPLRTIEINFDHYSNCLELILTD